ncbi:MalY/PatB family protein [Fictibacillus barbaricus]|uniref:cysteine-S-conjugate beta-lyase n=1 Tax=Fictibacillus barbaricus TaxID=182136 RepID=A0ABS2ZA66_9BACL|nr:MalY/PatB family protein [Fictibacillus barbaricus]MBN3545073.1 pyridoxal phosphate-dependent aminotransferase [Fictibacillus barbaricus]GGB61953.1 aminotransferase [Fictibacillus barbaricus]
MKHSFDDEINRLGTFCTQWDYIEDRFGEKDLLPFSISDTDFKVPQEVLEALKNRIDHGIFGYTRWNHEEFKGSIEEWYRKRFSSFINKDWIAYSPSVIYSISKLIEQLTDQGDHIVVQTPAYDAFFKLIKDNKRVLSENKLIYEKYKYSIDFQDLDEKLAHPRAKVLILCSPHNPTGRVWTRDELNKIISLCKKHGVYIISDEIHMDIVLKPNRHIPIVEVAGEYLENISICTSASKTFNTPGLGGSYTIIPNEIIREEFLLTLKNKDGLSSTSTLGAIALMTAYLTCDQWVVDLNAYLKGNMEIVKVFLDTHLPAAHFHVPESTYLAWIDISDLPYSDEQLQKAMIHHGKVAIMPGEMYGKNGKGFIRMNVGCPSSKVIEGLQRLKKAIHYLDNKG